MGLFSKTRRSHEDIAKEITDNMPEEIKKISNVDVIEEEKEIEEKKEEKEPEVDKTDEKPVEKGSESSPEEITQELEKEKERLEKEVEDKKVADEAIEKEEEEKERKRNPKTEKRIGDLVRKLKEAEEKSGLREKETLLRLDTLEKENEELKSKSGLAPENSILAEVKSKEKQRLDRYREEDKSLPREQRREMARDEYEAWLIEDAVAATDWRVDQKLRAKEERQSDMNSSRAKIEVDSVLKKQKISRLRLEARHPELALDSVKEELRAQGMDEKQIHAKLYQENPKYKAMFDILSSDKALASKIALDPRGPEILEKEMMKRLETSVPDKNVEVDNLKEKIAELQEILNVEKERVESIDEGIVSKKGAGSMKDDKDDQDMTEVEEELKKIRKLGNDISLDDYKKAKEYGTNVRRTG